MRKHNVVELARREKNRDELTELIREGACKLIAKGLELELSELLSALSGREDEVASAAVVRNRYQRERDIQTGIGPAKVKCRRSVAVTASRSAFVRRWCRRKCARPRAWRPHRPGCI